MKAIIVDDIEENRVSLRKMMEIMRLNIDIVGEASSVEETIELVNSSEFDLLFLDVELGENKSFEIFDKLVNTDFKIIFVTAHSNYAIDAIRLSAVDFLLKPINPEDLVNAVKRVQKEIEKSDYLRVLETLTSNINSTSKEDKKILLKSHDSIKVVNVNTIVRCEANINYTTFYFTDQSKLVVSRPLKEFEMILKDYGFFRPHKSHLVNTNFISSFEKKEGGHILLSDNTIIPVSTRKKEQLFEVLSQL